MPETLKIHNLDPAPDMTLALDKRINVRTGDNGHVKTFLLDLA